MISRQTYITQQKLTLQTYIFQVSESRFDELLNTFEEEKTPADAQETVATENSLNSEPAPAPGSPSQPEHTAADPDIPAIPAVPAVPVIPSVPAAPAAPSLPAVPAVPAVPAIPAVPAVPVPHPAKGPPVEPKKKRRSRAKKPKYDFSFE